MDGTQEDEGGWMEHRRMRGGWMEHRRMRGGWMEHS